ncbi:uncharacterized protein CBL_11968 [Carabus blaptoides fortunei]
MALSQKHAGKCLVPWFCSAEWRLVFDKIYGSDSNTDSKRQALQILNIWKARTPLLPCGIEGTYIILEGIFLDRELYGEYNLRLLLSTSVMRFMNISASFNKHQSTFHQSARRMKLPDWLITLRHDTAHSQNLPSLDMLERALTFCLDWLYREYWRPFSSDVKDFIDTTEIETDKFAALKLTLEPLLSNYCYLNLTTHPYWNFTVIKHIADKEAKQALFNDLNLDINETTKIETVLQILWDGIETTLAQLDDVKQRGCVLADLLLEENVFLCSFDERTNVLTNGLSNTLPYNFLQLWNHMLSSMHRSGCLDALLEQLLNLLTADHETAERKQIAALWLSEIGKGLSKCIMAQDILTDLKKENNIKLPQRQLENMLRELCEVKCPESNEMLNLSLLSDIPDILTDCSKFKTFVLENPNEYTSLFIPELLNVNEVFKLNENKTQILELLNVFVSQESTNVSPKKIHTVEDVINTTMEVDETEQTSCQNGGGNIANTENEQHNEDSLTEKRWRRVTDIDFTKCPIGILPWQSTEMNPMILHMN